MWEKMENIKKKDGKHKKLDLLSRICYFNDWLAKTNHIICTRVSIN